MGSEEDKLPSPYDRRILCRIGGAREHLPDRYAENTCTMRAMWFHESNADVELRNSYSGEGGHLPTLARSERNVRGLYTR